jgi:P-type E1-E2 ATPase
MPSLSLAYCLECRPVRHRNEFEKDKKNAHCVCQVKALRLEGSKRTFTTIQSDLFVPGDIILIRDQTVIPCDIILLKGVAVINEGMLTGESIPAI